MENVCILITKRFTIASREEPEMKVKAKNLVDGMLVMLSGSERFIDDISYTKDNMIKVEYANNTATEYFEPDEMIQLARTNYIGA
jgi:hypothetical protein